MAAPAPNGATPPAHSSQGYAQPTIRGANDNAIPGDACVTDAGAVLPVQELSNAELLVLSPLINALARLAAKRLSATTHSSEAP